MKLYTVVSDNTQPIELSVDVVKSFNGYLFPILVLVGDDYLSINDPNVPGSMKDVILGDLPFNNLVYLRDGQGSKLFVGVCENSIAIGWLHKDGNIYSSETSYKALDTTLVRTHEYGTPEGLRHHLETLLYCFKHVTLDIQTTLGETIEFLGHVRVPSGSTLRMHIGGDIIFKCDSSIFHQGKQLYLIFKGDIDTESGLMPINLSGNPTNSEVILLAGKDGYVNYEAQTPLILVGPTGILPDIKIRDIINLHSRFIHSEYTEYLDSSIFSIYPSPINHY